MLSEPLWAIVKIHSHFSLSRSTCSSLFQAWNAFQALDGCKEHGMDIRNLVLLQCGLGEESFEWGEGARYCGVAVDVLKEVADLEVDPVRKGVVVQICWGRVVV